MLADLGVGGLLLWSLLAATLVPLSSEVALVTAHAAGVAEPPVLLAAATAGNVGGALINWYLGAFCLRFKHRRWFPITDVQLQKPAAVSGAGARWPCFLAGFQWLVTL